MPRGLVHSETIVVDGEKVSAPEVYSNNDDEDQLRQLGYKQELRRELNLLRNFAVSFGLLSMLTGLGGYYSYGFTYGGPVVVIWGWVLIVSMTLTIALSMAEICSSLPTTGGVYYWAGVLGAQWGPLFAWVCGWLNLLGQVGITAGVEYTVVNYLQAMIQVTHPGFTFAKGEFWGVYFGVTAFHGVLNAISVKVLGWLSIASVYWHVLGTVGIVITLPVVAMTHQTAKWVFTEFIPPSSNPNNFVPPPGSDEVPGVGISNNFYIFILGLLLSQWAMVGYDSSAHIAEETKNAAVAGPVGLIMAICGSFICGWMFQLSLTFSIQNTCVALDPMQAITPSTVLQDGQCALDDGAGGLSLGTWQLLDPYSGAMGIIKGVFASRYGPDTHRALWIMVIMFVASNFCGTFCVTSNSRMLYAFARDVPAMSWFKRVNQVTGTPINSIIIMVVCAGLLGLTMLGSTVAFNAIASIGIIGLIFSYLIPILLRLTIARKWFKKGPFHLGPMSIIIGWVAIVWGLFICVVLMLPTSYPIDVQNLNYSPIALGGTILLSLIFWWMPGIGAIKWFKGPVRNIDSYKTHMLCEAYMAGEMDETDEQFGNENGAKPEASGKASSTAEAETPTK